MLAVIGNTPGQSASGPRGGQSPPPISSAAADSFWKGMRGGGSSTKEPPRAASARGAGGRGGRGRGRGGGGVPTPARTSPSAVVASPPAPSSADGDRWKKAVPMGRRLLRVLGTLGTGGFAKVYEVEEVTTGVRYALKKSTAPDESAQRLLKREANIARLLPRHPNIVRLVDSMVVLPQDAESFGGWLGPFRTDRPLVLLLMELCNGRGLVDLVERITVDARVFSEKFILTSFLEVCEAVHVLHSMEPPIVHRDIKVENVLIHDGHMKLADFGSCTSH